jgi:hypothetical protein
MTPSTKNWRSRQIELLDTTMTNQAKNTIRHDPSYKKLEVKTNRTSGHHYDEPSTKTQ